ncbi:uncharacterized protein LOC115632892 [Scaptodrosophila lebanonensis]|uniref:Uncharacterized protein LOC115632892 n=1 Tax=Drosophila lebanonensis TaxID=7225 RepID=A0A6J2UF56_DROLE|nr:uncharacterized protein LOC115632892 [Scaptodrosophila lebanonensis]
MLRLIHICTYFLLLCLALSRAQPVDYSNPKSQVEYISTDADRGPKPNIVPVTRPPLVIDTPPPAPANSKNFAFNPKTQTWTLIKPGDPQPEEGALLWNQSNDKWLTKVPGSLSI